MKTRKLFILATLLISNIGFTQLEEFETTISPAFSKPSENGWMYFNTPNNIQPGECFVYYKGFKSDFKNDMKLINVHTDSLSHYTHYKFQQTFNGIPVEGAGCIEHFDSNGNLIFTNSKHAIDIKENVIPTFNSQEIINILLNQLDSNQIYAWENQEWEQQRKNDLNDSTATWFPTPELTLSVAEIRDMQGDIDGSRYNLVYKIDITTISPNISTTAYYIDAHTGVIFKQRSLEVNNVHADVYGYGNRLIDAAWQGGFVQKYYLKAADGNHNIHTKKYVQGVSTWSNWPDTKKAGPNWGSTYLTESTAHYHVTNTWDYFYWTFGRIGPNGQGTELRVATQFGAVNAYYDYSQSPNMLIFGKTALNHDYGNEPSVVAHEYTHGINLSTANLTYEFQSGALSESYSDIFGIAYQAQYLDGGATDWIYGNFVPNILEHTRSFSNPSSRGQSWTGNYDANNNAIYQLGQPESYWGNNWCACPFEVNRGGVHINSGVQNRWFYLLSAGNNSNIQGIGITKASQIAYFALTSILNSSAQYYDSKNATIQAAIILFGECSQEHVSTVDAWNAVNVNASYSCQGLSVDNLINESDVLIYPNPTNSILNFEISKKLDEDVIIYDLKGKIVKTFQVSSTYYNADVSDLEKGVYLIHFIINDQTLIKRIVIQ